MAMSRRSTLEAIAFAVAILGLAVVTRIDAGLSGAWQLIGLLCAAPLYVVARGWRLPWWLHVGAAALPLSIVVTALTHDDGWEGAARATRYAWGALLFLGIAAWAHTPTRRLIAATAGALLVLDQYLTSWFPWWGGGSPTAPMIGSFYWHNQFGIYCVVGAALGVVLAVASRRYYALIGGIAVMFATAGVLESASRADLVLFGVVAVAGLAIAIAGRGWRGIVRWGVLAILGAATALVMVSAVFFPHAAASSPTSAVVDYGNAPGHGTDDSFGARLQFWRIGLQLGADHPVTGSGLATYGARVVCYANDGGVTSNPHNEWVLAWAESGIVGLLPMLALLVAAAWLFAVSVARIRSRRVFVEDAGRWAGLLALVLLLGHAAFDFDWVYPPIVAMTGLVGALAAAPVFQTRFAPEVTADAPQFWMPRWTFIVALACVVVLLVAGILGFAFDPLADNPLHVGSLAGEPRALVCG